MRYSYDGLGNMVVHHDYGTSGLGAIQTAPFQWVQPQNLQWFQRPAPPPRFPTMVATGCSSEFPNKNCPGNIGSCCDQSCTACSGFVPQSQYITQPGLVSELTETGGSVAVAPLCPGGRTAKQVGKTNSWSCCSKDDPSDCCDLSEPYKSTECCTFNVGTQEYDCISARGARPLQPKP